MTSMAGADKKYPDLRVSDAERDAVASELGQHFRDGRLDQAEYDERVTAAITAKTARDLDELLTDLPHGSAGQAGWAAGVPDQARAPAAPATAAPPGLTPGRPRAVGLLSLLSLPAVLAAAVVVGALLAGGWWHGWPFAPFGFLWLIVPILVARACVRGGRLRQWR